MTWIFIGSIFALAAMAAYVRFAHGPVWKRFNRRMDDRTDAYWSLFIKALPAITLIVWAVIWAVDGTGKNDLDKWFEDMRHPFLEKGSKAPEVPAAE